MREHSRQLAKPQRIRYGEGIELTELPNPASPVFRGFLVSALHGFVGGRGF